MLQANTVSDRPLMRKRKGERMSEREANIHTNIHTHLASHRRNPAALG